MSTPIVFPDVELWTTGYLRGALPAHGYTLWSAGSPSDSHVLISNHRETQKTAVWVRRDGGPVLDVVRETARLGVNVFAPTEQGVADLARVCAALLRAGADGLPVLRVDQTSGPSPIADDSGIPRRYMTFELTVRGVEL